PSRHPDTALQPSARFEPAHCRGQLQPRPHGPLSVILMGPRIAEVREDTVAQISRHEAVEVAHGFGYAFLIGRNDLAQVLRVHARGKCGRADEVGEHHRDLAAFCGIYWRVSVRDSHAGADRLCTQIERTNGFQEPETSPKWKTQLAEMIVREIVQDVGVDRVLAENRLILFETKAPQPIPKVHDGALALPLRAI